MDQPCSDWVVVVARAGLLVVVSLLIASLVLLAAGCAAPGIRRPPASPSPIPSPQSPLSSPTAVPASPPPSVSSASPAVEGPPLVVNDVEAANPELVNTQLQVPAGLNVAPHTVQLPPGYSISVLAAGLDQPRLMAFDPAGNLLVGSTSGDVYRFPAANGAIAPAERSPEPLLSGLDAPQSLAFYGGYLYVAETGQISRYTYGTDGTLGPREVVVPDLPVDGGHFTRTVVFGPDGKMYVGVGSSCNICNEHDERRAAISRYNPDGTGYERFAWGMRNPVGLAIQPGTGLLWATVNERDNQGNEIPPDLVTIARQGQDFGWPRCRPPNAAPQNPGNNCAGVTPPTVAIQAHSAPLGLAFYTGGQFPSGYRNDLFVAQHGSWNRQPPAAPQLLRVHIEGGRPVSVRIFATGWQIGNSEARWGRPVGLIVAPDGSLIVSDDDAGLLYRISYSG